MNDVAQAPTHEKNEELDVPRLLAFLRSNLEGFEGEVEVHRFGGGHSNRTYAVRSQRRRLVLRMPPAGKHAAGAHDMAREHRMLAAIHPVFPLAPKAVASSSDASILGAPFHLMEEIEGVVIGSRFPAGIGATEGTRTAICGELVRTLAGLHSVDVGAPAIAALGEPTGYVLRQLEGFAERYARARTDELPAVDEAFRWLGARLPSSGPVALLHNDFKLDNLLFRSAEDPRVVGVLDWEMAALGDPRMDLGTALASWVEREDPLVVQMMRLGPTNEPGMLSRAALVERYAELTGIDTSAWRDFHVFGLVKLGVVAQQLYARFVRGETRDPRLAMLGRGIPLLFDFCREQIELAEKSR